jgi:hypothetical protein
MVPAIETELVTFLLVDGLFPLSLGFTVYLVVRVGLARIVAWSIKRPDCPDRDARYALPVVKGFAAANALAVWSTAIGWLAFVDITAGATILSVLALVVFRIDRRLGIARNAS